MTDNIDHLSYRRYQDGADPIDVAVSWTATLLDARDNLRDHRSPDLPPLPAWTDLGNQALARKIVGRLLDAGWSTPNIAAPGEAK